METGIYAAKVEYRLKKAIYEPEGKKERKKERKSK